MNTIYQTLLYVTSQHYFWPSMAFTVMIGIYIGAVVYDGVLREVKKLCLSLFVYMSLLLIVNLTRVIPQTVGKDLPKLVSGYSQSVTIVLVTVFYFLGMYLGVRMVNKAHKGKER